MSHTRAPRFLGSGWLLTISLATLGNAQPFGFLTPVPASSFLRDLSVQSGKKLSSYPLPDPGLILGLAVNKAGTLLYTANNVNSGAGPEVNVTALPSGTQVASIPLSFQPYSLLLAPGGSELYVSGTVGFTSASLAVINTDTNSLLTTLTLNVTPDPSAAFPMAITPDGGLLYLAAGGLVRLNTATKGVLTFSSPGSFSQGIAITPDGSQLWFGLNNEIQVRDALTVDLIATISTPGTPYGGNGLLITPDGTEAILANVGLRAFDTSTFQLIASTSSTPFEQTGYIAPGPDTGSFLITDVYGSLVLRVSNTFTLLATYPQAGVATDSIALPGGQEILAANSEISAVGLLNSTKGAVTASFAVGCQAGVPGVNAARSHVYVPVRCSQDIAILDFTSQPIARLLHGPIFPTKALVSPDESSVYAADLSGIQYAKSGEVEVLDVATSAVIATLTGSLTIDVALSADGSQLYVDNNGPGGAGLNCPIGGVCVFDTGTFSLTAQVPDVFGFLALSQDGSSLYVGPDANSLTVINTASFSQIQISLPVALTALGSVAINPVNTSALVFGNTSTGPVGFVLDTSANQITGQFPVPAGYLASAAFTPDGSSIWFLSGTSPSMLLVEESFPAGQVVTQAPASGTSILF